MPKRKPITCPRTKLYIVVYADDRCNGRMAGAYFVNETRLSRANRKALEGMRFKEFVFYRGDE